MSRAKRNVLRLVLIGAACVPLLSAPLVRAEDPSTPQAAPASQKLLRITLRGEISEGAPPLSLFGPAAAVDSRRILDTIRNAAANPQIAGLVVRIASPSCGWTQRQALRRALLDFRASGKPSYAYFDAAAADYLIASAAKEVSMPPSGLIEIPGVTARFIHFKGLLEKIGVRFEELRMGRYKSALEPFTRDEPSGPAREEMHAILDEFFAEYVDSIAENRRMSEAMARSLVDRALFRADEALEAGLVDRVEYEDEFLERVRKHDGRKLELADARFGRELDLDLSGLAGFMKLLNELFGGRRGPAASQKPKIAIVYARGAIVDAPTGSVPLFGGALITPAEMSRILRRLRDDASVKAVVLRIDSPGGSALASDLIWREVRKTAESKPVVVSMGDVAASGGYYIACAATWIVAERSTLTGSIGVIGGVPNLEGLFEKAGLRVTTLSRGRRAGLLALEHGLDQEARELLEKLLREIYQDFIARVAEGRKLPPKAVEAIAEGRVWTGSQAKRLGLVDELGGLEAALAKARELGKVEGEPEIAVYPEPKTFLDLLGLSRNGAHLEALRPLLPPDVLRLLRRLEWISAFESERVLAVFPDLIEFR